MAAPIGDSVELAFRAGVVNSAQLGKRVLLTALRMIGLKSVLSSPRQAADAKALQPVRYLNDKRRSSVGSHTLVVTHDEFMSSFLWSLGLVTPETDNSMFPLESFVFAFSEIRASVVRMRMDVNDNGVMQGPFSNVSFCAACWCLYL